MRRILVLASIVASLGAADARPVDAFAAVDDVGGWGPGHVAHDDLMSVAVADHVGGRALRFDLDGRALLWLGTPPADVRWGGAPDDPEQHWRYEDAGGFRCWPAPQSAWKRGDDPMASWPPPPRLDHGVNVCRPLGDALLCEGPVEDSARWRCTGLRFAHVYTRHVGTTRMTVATTMTNTAAHAQRWAIWDATAVAVAATAAADRRPCVLWPMRRGQDSRFVGGAMRQAGQPSVAEDPARGVLRMRTDHPGKVGGDPDRGWLLLHDPVDGVAYIKRFAHDALAWSTMRYPEGGCTVAVCADPRGFVELEVMSPEVDLAPGGSTTMAVTWSACRVDGEPCDVGEHGVTVRPLSARREAGRLRIAGSFGVEQRGVARIRVGDGPAVAEIAATPLAPLVIDLDLADAPGDAVTLDFCGGCLAGARID
ncbi:MAG TPA: hypothetical protein VEL07_09815 [Planctomycetota bacterium]|nr:hypothetical protein [Planctomycetota bacterium]